jgi:hypothetical protein
MILAVMAVAAPDYRDHQGKTQAKSYVMVNVMNALQ